MSERITKYGSRAELVNKMADGVIVNDMKNRTLKFCNETKDIYSAIGHILKSILQGNITNTEK